MPLYEYECNNCRYITEQLQNISDKPLVICPRCNKESLNRLFGSSILKFKTKVKLDKRK